MGISGSANAAACPIGAYRSAKFVSSISSSSEMRNRSSARSVTTELTTTWRYEGCEATGLPYSVSRSSDGSTCAGTGAVGRRAGGERAGAAARHREDGDDLERHQLVVVEVEDLQLAELREVLLARQVGDGVVGEVELAQLLQRQHRLLEPGEQVGRQQCDAQVGAGAEQLDRVEVVATQVDGGGLDELIVLGDLLRQLHGGRIC